MVIRKGWYALVETYPNRSRDIESVVLRKRGEGIGVVEQFNYI